MSAHPSPETGHSHSPEKPESFLPLPLWIAFIGCLAIGVVLLATGPARASRAAYDAMVNCSAGVREVQDGLNDEFGIVQFREVNKQPELAQLLSMCERQPDRALDLYHKAMESDNKSARLIATTLPFYLTSHQKIESSDWEMLVKCLDAKADSELRRAAQRAISDLTVIVSLENTARFEVLPPELPAVEKDAPAHKIQTRREKDSAGTETLAIRWSNPDLAYAWLKTTGANGKWDKSKQRFVVP